jgi:IclR family pca regulon transcriptional regulator
VSRRDPRKEARIQQPLRTLARGLAVLECFTPARPTLTYTEIMESLQLPSPTVARFLESLELLGYVSQAPETGYRLTVKSLRLAQASLGGLLLPPWILSRLESLAQETGVIWSLRVLQGQELVRVSFGGWRRVSGPLPIGDRRWAAANTPSAVAILAFSEPSLREAFIADAVKRKPDFSVPQFRRELDETVARGFAMADRPDLLPAQSAIAVPVWAGRDRPPVASLAVYAPLARQNAEALARRLSASLLEVAAAISDEMETGEVVVRQADNEAGRGSVRGVVSP